MISEPHAIQDVLRAKNGDSDAFTRLIKRYERNLYGLARLYLKQDEDCSDAIQETIYKSYRAIQGLKEPEHFKTWLLRILIHECMHMLRVQKRMRLIESASLQGAAVKAPYETVEIRDAVSCLENDLRVMIQLHYYQDLPIKRIASMIKVPEGTVKSRLHRARTLLAEALEPTQQRRVEDDPNRSEEHELVYMSPLPTGIRQRIDEVLKRIRDQEGQNGRARKTARSAFSQNRRQNCFSDLRFERYAFFCPAKNGGR